MRQDAEAHLRDLLSTDLDTVWRWRNDPEVSEFLSNLRVSRVQIDALFKGHNGGSHGRFFAIETERRQFVGYTGLRDIDWADRTALMDIIIGDKAFWGKGYGQSAVRSLLRFAFERLDLIKVSLAVLPFNARAIRCYEKCGFRRAGFFPDKYLRRGKMWQPIHMEATPAQFNLARKVQPS